MEKNLKHYIEPKDIESSIVKLWAESKGVMSQRASLFTLIIFVKQHSREKYLQTISEKLIEKFPCRLITVTEFEEEKEPYLRTYVGEMTTSEEQIFSDVIHFEVTPSYKYRIPFVVLPHLRSNLPVYLFWSDDPGANDPLAEALEKISTRTIFDSETTIDLPVFAKHLRERKAKGEDVRDLNWTRLGQWRHLWANFFNTKERVQELRASNTITLEYNAKPSQELDHTKILPVYFQAWIGLKMGWKISCANTEGDSLTFRYTKPDNSTVTVNLKPLYLDGVPGGRIQTIQVCSKEHELRFERDTEHAHLIRVHCTSKELCELPVYHHFKKASFGTSLIYEIYYQGMSDSFFDVLDMVAESAVKDVC